MAETCRKGGRTLTAADHVSLPSAGMQIRVDGELVTVIAATATVDGADLVVRHSDGTLTDAALTLADLASAAVPVNDAGGDATKALATMWGRWMQHAVPRIRSAVLATRPLRPYAHQDEAVFTHMLAQPRLRFLLADEPGTGKTIMTGMYCLGGHPSWARCPAARSSSSRLTWSRNGSVTCAAISRSRRARSRRSSRVTLGTLTHGSASGS